MWAERAGRAPALGGIGMGVVGVGLLLGQLRQGGVAPLAVAAAVALLLGAPAALAEWRASERAAPHALPWVPPAGESLADLVGFGVVAAALGTVGAGSWAGLAAAILAWPLGAAAHRRAGLSAAVLALVAVAAAVHTAIAATLAATPPPWTLLQPVWTELPTWGPPALIAGLYLGGAGTGQWAAGAPRPPGKTRAPLATAGAALVLAAVFAAERGAEFEAGLGAAESEAPRVLLALATAGAAAAVIGRPRGMGGAPWGRALAGATLTVILAFASAESRSWVTGAVLPWLGAGTLAITASSASGTDRWVAAGAAAALLLAGAAAGGPTLTSVADALWLGALLAGAFWLVATRLVLARRPA